MMCCHVVDAKPLTGTVFVCGEADEPAVCHFCGQPAAYLCDFKVERPVNVRADELRVGDRRALGDQQCIYHAVAGENVYLAFDVPKVGVQHVEVKADGIFVVRRSVTCDQPVCYFCCREPDDDVHHCMDHWRLPS